MICNKEEGQNDDWVFSNKDEGQLAAAASLGLLQVWDIDEGLESIDKYMERSEDNIQAGSYLALGILNSGIKNDADAAYAILMDKLGTAWLKLIVSSKMPLYRFFLFLLKPAAQA